MIRFPNIWELPRQVSVVDSLYNPIIVKQQSLYGFKSLNFVLGHKTLSVYTWKNLFYCGSVDWLNVTFFSRLHNLGDSLSSHSINLSLVFNVSSALQIFLTLTSFYQLFLHVFSNCVVIGSYIQDSRSSWLVQSLII